jgi:hypothetical protein
MLRKQPALVILQHFILMLRIQLSFAICLLMSVTAIAQSNTYIKGFIGIGTETKYVHERAFRSDNNILVRYQPDFLPMIGLGVSREQANGSYTELNVSGIFSRSPEVIDILNNIDSTAAIFDPFSSTRYRTIRVALEKGFALSKEPIRKIYPTVGVFARIERERMDVVPFKEWYFYEENHTRTGLQLGVIPRLQFRTEIFNLEAGLPVGFLQFNYDEQYIHNPNLTEPQRSSGLFEITGITPTVQIRVAASIKIK